MELGALLIVMTLVFYTNYFFSLINSKSRESIRNTNIRLDELRKIPVKTLKEQKEFINMRYSKKNSKITWISAFKFVLYVCLIVIIFRVYSKLLIYLPWEILWWHGLLFLFFFPMVMNYVLSFFGLQKKGVKIF